MDFDLDDLISNDAANNAKASTKFKPKAKPKPKPKPKTQPEQESKPVPPTQFVEAAATVENELLGRTEEEQPGSDFNNITIITNDLSMNSPPCSETPTIHVSMDGNLEVGPTEPESSNNNDTYTNLESHAQLDPLTGGEAAIFIDNEDFQIENLSSISKDAESSLFWEPLDILSQSNTCSGPRVGKFKPKPKAQTRKMEQIANTPDQDLVSVQYGENIHSVPSQTDYAEIEPVPSFTADEILGSSSIRVTDSDFHMNQEPINLTEISQVDCVLETPPVSTQQDQFCEPSMENQAGRSSERLKRRSNKTLELIDELDDEHIDDDFVHGNDNNHNNNNNDDDGDYGPENEPLSQRKGSKSKKAVNEKEKPVRKRKKTTEVAVESTKVAKKKFSHSSRRNRRQVNPELLKIPEDELELHTVPMKELIRLAEHRERIAKKEASTSGTPAMNQRGNSFSNDYDEDDPFAHGMEAENATFYNYRTHMKITPRMKWTKQDTELFYEAVQQFGTDLSMIKECFPGRTREQIKSKYKKEERQQPLRLNDALTTRAKGHSHFEVVIERIKQAQAQDSENDDPTNLTGNEDEEVLTTDINDAATTKLEKEVKEMEADDDVPAAAAAESPTKSHDSEDEMYRWSQYKSEI